MLAIGLSCALSVPALSLLNQALVLGIGLSLRAVSASLFVKNLLVSLGLDPVYASVFNRTLGNIETRGIAVAGPVGDFLHRMAPGLFASVDQVAPGAWSTTLVGSGVSVLASALATIGAQSIYILGGIVVVWLALRRRGDVQRSSYIMVALLGSLLQARGVAGLLDLRYSAQDLEIMGLSQFFTKLFPLDGGSYQQFITGPFALAAPYLVPAAMLTAIYCPVLAVSCLRLRPRLGERLRQSTRGLNPSQLNLAPLLGIIRPITRTLAIVFLTAMTIASVGFFPALADYDYPTDEQETAAQIAEALTPGPPLEQGTAATVGGLAGGPSKVTVTGYGYVYSYSVNSRVEKMRGVGYNALYDGLPPEARAARYDWDFAEMKAAGVNTILGWGLQRFDELTLTKAQEYGLGVIMPYRFSGNADYTSVSHQQKVREDVRNWIERYKSYPALRMWGIGNEVIHAINPYTAQAKAFGEFYVRLADEVHALDPDHPVLYRGAEDINIGPIREALSKDGIHRPWFVYGGNYFTSRVCEAVPDWPKKGMNNAMLVSEFAPSGLGPEGRPQGYLRMLRCITKDAPFVLGAFAYVWSTEGPEALDRVFGLVNAQGEPVDRSLWALGRAYHRNSTPGYGPSHSPR